MSTLKEQFDEACYHFTRGTTNFRNVLSAVKKSLKIVPGELNATQREALKEYRTRLYVVALASLTSTGRPTQADYEQAEEALFALKGYNALAQDTDQRRTKEQERVLTNMRQAWSTACADLEIPAIDARGGSNSVTVESQDVITTRVLKSAVKDSPRALRLMPAPKIDEAEFAADMCSLMVRYLEANPSTGPYVQAMRRYIKQVETLRKQAEAA